MRTTDVQPLVDFLQWANARILDTAENLTTAEFTASGAITTRSLRATLVHELDVEWSWRLRLQDRAAEDDAELLPEDFPDLATLRARWAEDEAEMRAWVASLTDDDLNAPPASASPEMPLTFPLWHYLMHVLIHAAQQQADAATLLTQAGHSPGDIGYLTFVRSR